MSDSNTKRPHKFSVNMDDFVRFLVEKTPDAPCPGCGTISWTLIGQEENGQSMRMVVPLRDGVSPTFVNTFAVYCNECGYVRQHMARIVKAWVEANPEQPELDFEDEMEDDDQD